MEIKIGYWYFGKLINEQINKFAKRQSLACPSDELRDGEMTWALEPLCREAATGGAGGEGRKDVPSRATLGRPRSTCKALPGPTPRSSVPGSPFSL